MRIGFFMARKVGLGLGLSMALLVLAGSLALAGEPANDAALALLDQGELAAAGGNFDKARQLWEKALQERPGWEVAQRRLADLPARSRAYPTQVREIERNQQASLDFVEGVSLFNQGRYQEAAQLFATVAKVLPDHPHARQYLEMSQSQAGLTGHGSLQVDSTPPAMIHLDGQAVGQTPVVLNNVPAGRHTLTAEAHGVRLQKEIVVQGRTAHTTTFVFREVEGP